MSSLRSKADTSRVVSTLGVLLVQDHGSGDGWNSERVLPRIKATETRPWYRPRENTTSVDTIGSRPRRATLAPSRVRSKTLTTVVVTSPDSNAGKTTFAITLGRRLRHLGKTVDYRRVSGRGASGDAAFAATALGLADPATLIATPASGVDEMPSSSADVVLIEAGNPEMSAPFARASSASSVIVARFQADSLADRIIDHARALGISRAPVLINVVPEKGLRQVRRRVIPALQEANLQVVGVIPQDRVLLGTTVADLASFLRAQVLCARDQLDRPVEAVMIAAMSDEGATEYFQRMSRKVVVAAGDRPDIHLPALSTDTSCIVLSQGLDPDPTVLATADQLGVPLLKVQPDTFDVLELIADHFAEVRFRQQHKLGPALALFRAHLDEGALFGAIGIDRREVA